MQLNFQSFIFAFLCSVLSLLAIVTALGRWIHACFVNCVLLELLIEKWQGEKLKIVVLFIFSHAVATD